MATQQQLTEARAARHALVTGRKVATVTMNGRTVQYTETNLADLEAYIQRLESELGITTNRRRAFRVSL